MFMNVRLTSPRSAMVLEWYARPDPRVLFAIGFRKTCFCRRHCEFAGNGTICIDCLIDWNGFKRLWPCIRGHKAESSGGGGGCRKNKEIKSTRLILGSAKTMGPVNFAITLACPIPYFNHQTDRAPPAPCFCQFFLRS